MIKTIKQLKETPVEDFDNIYKNIEIWSFIGELETSDLLSLIGHWPDATNQINHSIIEFINRNWLDEKFSTFSIEEKEKLLKVLKNNQSTNGMVLDLLGD